MTWLQFCFLLFEHHRTIQTLDPARIKSNENRVSIVDGTEIKRRIVVRFASNFQRMVIASLVA